MAKGGNAQEETGEEAVGASGGISTADLWGKDPTDGARMGDNGPYPER